MTWNCLAEDKAVTIKVLVVDDSALMRALLTEIINGAPDLQVVGTAPDALAAREMIKTLDPDVMTLDVEMPRMDGLEFLSRVMRLRPMPVVMISSFTDRGSEVTLQALELGAVDYIPKPRAESVAIFQNSAEDIREKIRAAHGARVRALPSRAVTPAPAPRAPASSGISTAGMAGKLIAIGASTGGTEAIREVLEALPADIPGVVIVQHMPESFTPSFAKRLDSASRLTVVEARGGERVQPEPVNRHRPAVDVLFSSVAAHAGANVIGVILTGMGKDGAQGMLEMRQRGAWNIGQDEATCVVYGMPREAARVGALDEVVPLGEVAARVVARLRAARA